MNVEIGTETPIFLFGEYLFRNFVILSLQCIEKTSGHANQFNIWTIWSMVITLAQPQVNLSVIRYSVIPDSGKALEFYNETPSIFQILLVRLENQQWSCLLLNVLKVRCIGSSRIVVPKARVETIVWKRASFSWGKILKNWDWPELFSLSTSVCLTCLRYA